mgnify:FL=1
MATRAQMAKNATQDASNDVGDARTHLSHATARETQARAHDVGTAQTQTSARIAKESFPFSALKSLRARLGKRLRFPLLPDPARTQSTERSR